MSDAPKPRDRCNKGHLFTPATTITARNGKRRCRICLEAWNAKRVRPPCEIENCGKPAKARKWCRKHYGNWLAYGDPLGLPGEVRDWPGERWLPVPGWERLYEVSDHGRVWSVRSGRTLKLRINREGYPYVALCYKRTSGGRQVTMPVHRIEAAAFLGRRRRGQGVRHLDGNPQNNLLPNLCYGTQKENLQDAMRHGTHRNMQVRARESCVNGHRYLPGSFYFNAAGSKVCRTCDTEKAARYHRRKRAGATA